MRVSFFVGTTYGLPSEEVTFAELLKKRNYATAAIGERTLLQFRCQLVYHKTLLLRQIYVVDLDLASRRKLHFSGIFTKPEYVTVMFTCYRQVASRNSRQ